MLGGAVVGLLLALMSVLPTPNLGLLWLALFARRAGFRRNSLVAAVLGVVTVALALVPVVQGWRTASQEDVSLSLSEYFSFPSLDSPLKTVTYARPEAEELKLDVRRPPDEGNNARPEQGRRWSRFLAGWVLWQP